MPFGRRATAALTIHENCCCCPAGDDRAVGTPGSANLHRDHLGRHVRTCRAREHAHGADRRRLQTRACVSLHGAAYVLVDGKNVYVLSDQKTPGELAGQKVKVVGTLDAKTKAIRVESMTAAS